ncbi:diadenosine tetraphosphate (Ap4A) HIT family hydrolase [Methylohalomonas lacus]|uniref:Diadenosine tetraphosphate (Ap4A) HIT family hydrolase n=1 Tax=Methylohalomonas lacus TaxID=398773 RepID=A0AAE3L126_9GAMM|nr:HIT family protein [Methylohalomonas lacus]MCS3903414.1 diadenosine tetraphosphate (Ap4A) HIT family hydrolase [Methylohalomonas lacus]
MTSLHPQLSKDCHYLGAAGTGTLLLHRNASLPWLILVPATAVAELHELDSAHYHQVLSEVRRLARFVKKYYQCERINIATIGNLVPQLHIHIVGRSSEDACWPQPVWGHLQTSADYAETEVRELTDALLKQQLLREPSPA